MYAGQVKEKEKAHREYREAISKGHGAYLMDKETAVNIIFRLMQLINLLLHHRHLFFT